jgi:hypothetical protein
MRVYSTFGDLPLWAKLLAPFLAVLLALWFMVVFAVLLLMGLGLFLPYFAIQRRLQHRRLLNHLRQAGRILSRDEARSALRNGRGVLLVEMEPYAWFCPLHREQLDPDSGLIPLRSYFDFKALEPPSVPVSDDNERLMDLLDELRQVASLVPLSWPEIEQLAEEFPQDVLAVPHLRSLPFRDAA